MEDEPTVIYYDGEKTRALKGILIGETPDGQFFVVKRPFGDLIWVRKTAVASVSGATAVHAIEDDASVGPPP